MCKAHHILGSPLVVPLPLQDCFLSKLHQKPASQHVHLQHNTYVSSCDFAYSIYQSHIHDLHVFFMDKGLGCSLDQAVICCTKLVHVKSIPECPSGLSLLQVNVQACLQQQIPVTRDLRSQTLSI